MKLQIQPWASPAQSDMKGDSQRIWKHNIQWKGNVQDLTLHLWIANKNTKVGMGGEGTSLKESKLTPLQPSHLK
jgi:alpha-tubulin suppressor-like RCC1 family protein